MNIMIVSLIERTREIGILKALGMKSRTVLYIFLTESVIIGLIGAVIGIISGWVLANVIALFLGRGGIIGSALTITPILTPEVLSALPWPQHGFEGQRVVYGEGCTVSGDHLKAENVSFKQIPYQIEGI